MEDNKATEPKAISFEHLGGKRLKTAAPVKGEKEVDFSEIGGKVVQRSPLWADSDTVESKPVSVEKKDDARE